MGDRSLKKIIVVGILCCAVLFFAAGYFSRAPKVVHSATNQEPWNSQAIRSSFTGVQVRELDSSHAAVDFLYDLENRTNSDFELAPGPNAIVMKRLKVDGSLSADANARLTSTAFIPTNNRTRVTLEVTGHFIWPAKQDASTDQALRDLVQREASGLDGFVIFDQASRYEIVLPIDLAASLPSRTATPSKTN